MKFRGVGRGILIIISFVLFAGGVAGENLKLKYSLNLEPKDRLLGDMTGDFLVYNRPYIKMYNSSGKRLHSRRLKNNIKPFLSPNGDFLVLVTYADRSPTDLKAIRFEIYDARGKQLHKVEKPEATLFQVSNEGWIIGVEGVAGIPPNIVHIYNPSGKAISKLSFDSFIRAYFTPSGEHIVVDKGKDGLEMFDLDGNSLRTLPVLNNYVIDGNDDYWGGFYGDDFHLYKEDTLLKRIYATSEEIIDAALTAAADRLTILTPRKLLAIELTSGKSLWEYTINEPDKYFSSLSVLAGADVIACGIDINKGDAVPKDERHPAAEVLVFGNNGEVLAQYSENQKSWSMGLPRVVLTNSSPDLIFLTNEKLTRFSYPPVAGN